MRKRMILLSAIMTLVGCQVQSQPQPYSIANSQVEVISSATLGEYKITTY